MPATSTQRTSSRLASLVGWLKTGYTPYVVTALYLALGAAWVYRRSGAVWGQQGPKLVGTGAVGLAWQGVSVAVSGDGTTAVMGGNRDNSDVGAAWVFTRTATPVTLMFFAAE